MLPVLKTLGNNRRGAFPWSPTSKSRQHPGHRVLDAGGDLSSDSSESHTDVARRDEAWRTPGLVHGAGGLVAQ
jgi:hypothetical protein